MLKMTKIALLGAVAVAGMASTAANAATQSATAEVDIIAAIELTKLTDMDLGNVAVGSAAGTVTLPTNSDTVSCSTVTCFGAAQRASFRVDTATDGYVINFSTPASINLTRAAGGAPMALTLTRSINSATYNSAAKPTVFVGGTLSVGASQTAGTYNGTFNLTADYQ